MKRTILAFPLSVAAVLLTLFLAACSSLPAKKSCISLPSGQRLCAVHRIPLITVDGYEDTQSIICPSEDDLKRMRRYPNSLGIGRTLRREAAWLQPCKITYCPRCEEKFEPPARLRPVSMPMIQGVYTLHPKALKTGEYYAGRLLTLGDGVFSSELFPDVGNSHPLEGQPRHGRFTLDGCLLELRYPNGARFHLIVTQRHGRFLLWTPKQYEEYLRTGRISEFVLYRQPNR